MKKLTIYNPVGLHGPMISACFIGDEYAAIQLKDEVQLVSPSGQELIYAEVLDLFIGPLSNAPAILLEMTHDPLQRSFTGMHMHLLARYTNGEAIAPEAAITILVLRPKQSTLIRPTTGQVQDLG